MFTCLGGLSIEVSGLRYQHPLLQLHLVERVQHLLQHRDVFTVDNSIVFKHDISSIFR